MLIAFNFGIGELEECRLLYAIAMKELGKHVIELLEGDSAGVHG